MTLQVSHRPEDYPPLKTDGISFHTVIDLGEEYEVYEFTKGYDPNRELATPYGVGRYDERRPGMYEGEQFMADRRDVHVGVDLAGPVGEPVHAFYAGGSS